MEEKTVVLMDFADKSHKSIFNLERDLENLVALGNSTALIGWVGKGNADDAVLPLSSFRFLKVQQVGELVIGIIKFFDNDNGVEGLKMIELGCKIKPHIIDSRLCGWYIDRNLEITGLEADSAELRSLKQSIAESNLKNYFPKKVDLSFHDKVVFGIDNMSKQLEEIDWKEAFKIVDKELRENHPMGKVIGYNHGTLIEEFTKRYKLIKK